MKINERWSRMLIYLSIALILASVLWAMLFILVTAAKADQYDDMMESKVVYHEDGKEYDGVMPSETELDPDEPIKIGNAVISTLGTDEEEQCFGFNATYVLKVLTAEAGHNEEVAYACATALFNECVKSGGKMSPVDAIEAYKWCDPVDWISEEAKSTFCLVFVWGMLDETVEDATIFYNPMYTTGTPYHESQEFVVEVNGVRFFREVVE